MLKILLLDDEDLKKELDGFIKNHKSSIKAIVPFSELINHPDNTYNLFKTNETVPGKIVINMADSIYFIKPLEIIRCESNRNYTKIFLTEKRELMVSKNLKILEKQFLKYNCFKRIHKSHLINFNFVEKFLKADGGYIILEDKTKLPVASRKKEQLFADFDKL